MCEKNTEIDEFLKINKIVDGRNNFVLHNNMCIIETISFYDHIFLNNIIKPVIFSNNYEQIDGVSDIFIDRLSFMDKYKLVCKIADYNHVCRFKKIDEFIKIRNNIAHNLTSIINIDLSTKESEVQFGNRIITWSLYKEQIKEWCNLSFELANFILGLYSKLNDSKNITSFMYCKTEGDCVLVQHNLIYPQIEGDYTSFFKGGFNMDLLDYLNNEVKFLKEKAE